MRYVKSLVLASLLVVMPGLCGEQPHGTANQSGKLDVRLPLKNGSVRWAVIGDNGTGKAPEDAIAEQMQRYWQAVHYTFVTMDGDNIYGGHSPRDFKVKFEDPYKPLLDEGVKFYASLGNHDDADIERNYKPFNMDGKRYYTFRKGNIEFFVLDSNYMDPDQLTWLQENLKDSNATWKIAYFHHPLFTNAKFHGPDLDLRRELMPLFMEYNVNAVWSGHEHVYERIQPQDGIYFFLEGESGQLRAHNIRKPDNLDIVGFDTGRSFMLVEVAGNMLSFQTIDSKGDTVDAGNLPLQKAH